MVIKAYINTYNRPEMLMKTVKHLESHGIDLRVYDDGSEERIKDPRFMYFKHHGKRNYWKIWNKMLHNAESNLADLYIFMPDDFQDLDVDRIIELHHKFKGEGYIYNIINDGRTKQWINQEPKKIDDFTTRVGFTDCGFFCNRPALHKLGFYMKDPTDRWFEQGENISSGVGMMLTKRAHQARIPIYIPKESLAYHGDHESKMHPEERKNNPLKSR